MMPILLNFERIVDGGTSNNFIIVIIGSFVVFGGMLEMTLLTKWCVLGLTM
jgi:hypothetical protein